MNYLIFRTDRIGDFLITLPLIKSIKRNNEESKIFVVTSVKNDNYVKSNSFVDDTFLLEKNTFISKIKLFIKLKKKNFDSIIVADKKNRSIWLSLFIPSKKKIFNVSKNFQKKLLTLIKKDVFMDNDNLKNIPIKSIIEMNCKSLDIICRNEDFNFFKENQFKNSYKYNSILDLDKTDYLIFHYDEKWEIKNYSKVFSKAKNLTNINLNINTFLRFLLDLTNKKNMQIVVTTGYLETDIVSQLKKISKILLPNVYAVNKNTYLFINQNFESISHLISKSKLFISCHGALTHIASCYNIEILDIIEQDKINHYQRITHHMKKYKSINRENFDKLSEYILKNT